MDISELETQLLDLPLKDRARLAQRLLESLDDLSEAESSRLWLDEAERRGHELDLGLEAVSAAELDRRVQARLR